MIVKDRMTPSRMNEKVPLVVNPYGSHVNQRGNLDAWGARRCGVAYAGTRRGCADGGAERAFYRRPHLKPVGVAAPEDRRPGGEFLLGLIDKEKVVAIGGAKFIGERREERSSVWIGADIWVVSRSENRSGFIASIGISKWRKGRATCSSAR